MQTVLLILIIIIIAWILCKHDADRSEHLTLATLPARFPATYNMCATQGQTCNAPNRPLTAYYGTGQSFVTAEVNGPFTCGDAKIFTEDPDPSVSNKSCYVTNTIPLPPNYIACGNENETCNIKKPTLVYYGIDGQYYSQTLNKPFVCDLSLFPGDSYPLKNKLCYVPAEIPTPESTNVYDETYPTGETITLSPNYTKCANENETCNNVGSNAVIYGSNGHFTAKKIIGGFECNNTIFGSDPSPGRAKSCYVPVA